MLFGILHRMILRELAKVFILSLVGITGILVMAGVIAEAQQQGLSPSQILMAIPLLIPSTLPYTIPATTLFATCVVYGRLSADNEILAIRAAGVHLVRVVWPGALLGLVMSGVTMGMYYSIIPTTTHLLRSRVLNDVEEYLYAILRKDKCIKQPSLGWAMWVHRVQGTQLQEALFKRQNNEGRYDTVARARTAELRVFLPQKKILVQMNQCDVTNDEGTGHLYFESQTFEVELPKELADTKKIRARAMTWPELFARRRELRGEEQVILDDIADVEAGKPQPPGTPAKDLNHLRWLRKYKRLEILSVDVEIQMRPALSFGCLCFVLIGCPVGIWFSRSDYLSSFITCFMPICFLYYPMLLCGTSFGKSGQAPTFVAVWAADGMIFMAAVGLFRRLLRN